MINLRYHIVSITAVFLALGIGLTLGSTFLDRVTVDTLKNQLDTVQARVDETEEESSLLRERVAGLEAREQALTEAMGERLVDGHLEEVPVLAVVAAGTPSTLVEQALTTLEGAGADLVGSWELTDRWDLDDEDEVRELAEILDLSTDDADRLRRSSAIRLADELIAAVEPDPVDDEIEGAGAEAEGAGAEPQDAGAETEEAGPGTPDGEPTMADPAMDQVEGEQTTADQATPGQEPGDAADDEAAPTPPAEPETAAELEAAGFIEYGALRGDSDRVLLPAEGLRVVVIAHVEPDAGSLAMAVSLMDEITAEGPVPVVAAQGDVALTDDDGDPLPEADRRTGFVGPLRSGELTRDRLATVDAIDTPGGLAALVLAVEDAGELRLGHYGVAPGSSRLLPGTEPAP